tara:strand:+ start:486 stop:662 length:177 start_codon:yes stop_codon:yes gene_type:complete
LRAAAGLRLRRIIGKRRADFEKVGTTGICRTLGRISLLALDEFIGGITFDRFGPVCVS